jgi:sulfhydrogenase subunit beta (sulfur reductase)
MDAGFLPRTRFQALLDALREAGYRCIGPQSREGAVVYDTLSRSEEFAQGIEDRQAPGAYRLVRTANPRLFSWANGPQALKPLLFAPKEQLWRAERAPEGGIRFSEIQPAAARLAVIGVRACDLAALRLQDQHFLNGSFADPYYSARRRNLLLIAVHCTHPAETCFCASTGDGPRATRDFDLALNELDDGYLVQVGSDQGRALVARLPLEPVMDAQRQTADQQVAAAAQKQVRRLPSRNLQSALFANLSHPRWDQVAERCLACGNCTSVCPTCFCHSDADETALDESQTHHVRQWDSCFTQGHSYIHGMTLRAETRARYRQWLTHKLGSWHEQYGRSGCVGCGRCITWCPVGIDITEEAREICAADAHG